MKRGMHMLGRKLSEETKRKMGLSHLGSKRSKETREKLRQQKLGSKNPSYGRKYTIEERKILSEKNKKFWGNRVDVEKQKIYERIRHSLEMRLWREAVFKKDDFTCIWCGDNRGGNLEADHIQEFAKFPDLRFAIDNGRTLCKPCHKRRHYGNN